MCGQCASKLGSNSAHKADMVSQPQPAQHGIKRKLPDDFGLLRSIRARVSQWTPAASSHAPLQHAVSATPHSEAIAQGFDGALHAFQECQKAVERDLSGSQAVPHNIQPDTIAGEAPSLLTPADKAAGASVGLPAQKTRHWQVEPKRKPQLESTSQTLFRSKVPVPLLEVTPQTSAPTSPSQEIGQLSFRPTPRAPKPAASLSRTSGRILSSLPAATPGRPSGFMVLSAPGSFAVCRDARSRAPEPGTRFIPIHEAIPRCSTVLREARLTAPHKSIPASKQRKPPRRHARPSPEAMVEDSDPEISSDESEPWAGSKALSCNGDSPTASSSGRPRKAPESMASEEAVNPQTQPAAAWELVESASGSARGDAWQWKSRSRCRKPLPMLVDAERAASMAYLASRSRSVAPVRLGLELGWKRQVRISNLHAAWKQSFMKMYRFLVRRSGIAELGVYTSEAIPAGELLMEYVGQVVRRPVADVRERNYEAHGIGCYFFALDADQVIDATRHGNIARFINHCCSSNCTAKKVEVGSQMRIFIFAAQDLAAGDELTYDYCLSAPDERSKDKAALIPCRCGASTCRGHL